MEFNQLESFLSVVKHKSFSKAAKEMYLTQPTVSNNIQNLER
ncbi:MAG: LysR family transcriptional regulator, partial [Firmicutes bacterium HGW-Firmicutes-18]